MDVAPGVRGTTAARVAQNFEAPAGGVRLAPGRRGSLPETLKEHHTTMRQTARLFLLLAPLSLAGVPACAPVDGDDSESAAQAVLEDRWTQWFGVRDQAVEREPSGLDADITQIDAYEDGNFVYGIRLHWGDVTQMYGHTNNLAPNIFTPGAQIYRVDLHRSAGVLRGMRFYPAIGNWWSIGQMNTSPTTAFTETVDTPNTALRSIRTSSTPITGVKVLCAVRFQY